MNDTMMRDLKKHRPIEQPMPMDVLDPETQTPMLLAPGKPVRLMLFGIDSVVYQRQEKALNNRRLAQAQRTRQFITGTSDQLLADRVETCVVCTAGWDGIGWEGKTLECTPDNARMIYTEVRWLFDQVEQFIQDRRNFFKNSPAP